MQHRASHGACILQFPHPDRSIKFCFAICLELFTGLGQAHGVLHRDTKRSVIVMDITVNRLRIGKAVRVKVLRNLHSFLPSNFPAGSHLCRRGFCTATMGYDEHND